MTIIHVTDTNFKGEVLESALPVLVDFWAPWCGPCKMVAPVLDELAKEFDGKIKICKINIDDHDRIASQYGIMSIPTLIFFRQGQVVDQLVGALDKAELKRNIEEHL